MIGYLKGVLLSRHDPILLIDVSGVGYRVCAAADVLNSFHVGDTIQVFIHTHVREDTLDLYAFADESCLELFELLISVNGVGPKTAIGVFAQGKKEQILAAIRQADVDFFTGIPRLGKKNAQKIIIELKNKLGSIEELDLTSDSDEVTQALLGFGFRAEEIRRVIRELGEKGDSTEEKIKLALKQLGR